MFNVVDKIPGHVTPPPLNQCDDPTINGQSLTSSTPPPPPPSAQQGQAPPGQTQTTNPASATGLQTGRNCHPMRACSPVAAPPSEEKSKGRRTADGGTLGTTSGQGQTQTLAVASGPMQVPPARDPLPLLLYVVGGAFALVALFGPPTLTVYLRKQRLFRLSSRDA